MKNSLTLFSNITSAYKLGLFTYHEGLKIKWKKGIFLLFCVPLLTVAHASTIDILPLGDSITYGYPAAGGWRDPLYQELGANGISCNFVGESNANSSAFLNSMGDPYHDGFPGCWINNLTVPVASDLPFYQPDDVLLQVGINDILNGRTISDLQTDITGLVNQIFSTEPTVHLYLASILPNLNLSLDPEVQAYNNYISSTLVPDQQALGRNITFVDQYANFVDGAGAPISSLYDVNDPTHPNAAGYLLMANTWFDAMAVPEPASAILTGLGGIGLVALMARRRFVRHSYR